MARDDSLQNFVTTVEAMINELEIDSASTEKGEKFN